MDLQPEIAALVGEIDFDPDALLEKYLFERDKRLREDGAAQYVEVKAEFSHYVDDPYVEPGFTASRCSTRWSSPSSAAVSAGF